MLRAMLAFAVMAFLSSAAVAERRVALVFGADEYRAIRPLANAVNDARAVEDALRALGFEVFSEHNRDLRRMRRALDDFAEDAAGADVALVFFAGHGVEISGHNRLLPVDADISSLDSLERTSLPLEEVRETANAAAAVALIVLDACRDDPFGLSATGDGRGAVSLAPQVAAAARPGLGRAGRAENTLFAFSAAPGETAADGSGQNSPFTAALTRYLATDGLEIRSVLTLVQQEVYDFSGGSQLPYVESGLPSLFFAAATGDLPERERLLLAMADVTASIRDEVERVAVGHDMPLAPLYAALVSENLAALPAGERVAKLAESAEAFVRVRQELRTLSSADPQVTALRLEAEKQLSLGAVEAALARLDQAAGLDSASRDVLRANYVERTLSEAATHYLSGGAARTDLRYERAIADYEQAASLYAEVDALAVPDDDRQRHLDVLAAAGETYLVVGRTDRALRVFAERLALAERLAAGGPANLQWQRELGASHIRVGEVELQRGNLAGAEAAFQNALPIATRLAAALSDSALLQRDLALAHGSLGDARLLKRELAGARQAYQAGFEIVERLAAADPGDAMLQRDLSVAHINLGDVHHLEGSLGAALEAYRRALAIRLAQAAADPADKLGQSDVASARQRIGDMLRLLDEPEGALDAYGEALAVSEALAAADPDNHDLQHVLVAVRGRIADIHRNRGDPERALAAYREGLAIQQRLVALDPSNADWRTNLMVFHDRIGTLLSLEGDHAGALAAAEAILALRREAAEAAPDDLALQHALFGDLTRTIERRRAAGDLLGALLPARSALEIAERLVAADRQNADWRWSLFTAHWHMADFVGNGIEHYGKALAVLEALEAEGRLAPWQAEWLEHTRMRLAFMKDALAAE